jgi:hypothetical protein
VTRIKGGLSVEAGGQNRPVHRSWDTGRDQSFCRQRQRQAQTTTTPTCRSQKYSSSPWPTGTPKPTSWPTRTGHMAVRHIEGLFTAMGLGQLPLMTTSPITTTLFILRVGFVSLGPACHQATEVKLGPDTRATTRQETRDVVDGAAHCQPGGWRRHLFHSVRHHSLSEQRRSDIAFLGFGWYHDILVRTLLPSTCLKSFR